MKMAEHDTVNRAAHSLTEMMDVFERMTDGILLLNSFKQVIAVNRAAEEMLGWSNADFQQGLLFCDVCEGVVSGYNDEGLTTCIDCHVLTENSPYVELNLRHKDGTRISVTASSSLITDGGDSSAWSILSIRDISRQKQKAKASMASQLSNKMMHTLEEERKRVSKELHDGVGQHIFSIQMTLHTLRSHFKRGNLIEPYENLCQLTSQALEEVRNISTELRPSILDDLGLVPALRSYVKRVQSSMPFSMNIIYNRNARLHSYAETALYRIFQEALSNTLKYAEAEYFNVDLYFGQGAHPEVVMTVTDDGRGFLPDEIGEMGAGLGLFSMKERVSSLNGKIHIDSKVGEGTCIQVRLPQGAGSDA